MRTVPTAALPLPGFLIEKGVVLILIFTPLAFGCVQQWSESLMEIAAFSLFGLFLLRGEFPSGSGRHWPLWGGLGLFSALALFQMLPLPEGLLRAISPESLNVYENLGNYAPGTHHPLSLNPYAARQELIRVLAYSAVFFVVASHFRTKDHLNLLVKTIFFMGCFLAVFAVLQKVTWNGRIFWFYPVDEPLRSGLGIWGPYINRNHFAGYMEMAIPMGLGLLLYSAPDVKALPGVSSDERIARFLGSDRFVPFALIFLLLLIMSAVLLMTLSRGGITAFGISSLFFAWITWNRRSLRSKAVLLGLLGIVISVVVVFASWERLEERFEALGQEREVARLKIWEDSIGVVKDYPFLGSGLGTFENVFMGHQKSGSGILYDHAHNDYVELLTDTGFTGLLIVGVVAVFFFFTVYRAWSCKRGMFGKSVGAGGLSSCLAMGVHSFTDFNLHIPANALLLAVIAGVTYASVFNISERHGLTDPGDRRELSGGRRFLLILAVVLMWVILLFYPVRELSADYYYGKTDSILDDPDTEELDVKPIALETLPSYQSAIRSLETARALSPARALYARALSELYERIGRWAEAMELMKVSPPSAAVRKDIAFRRAVANLEAAVSLEPTNPDYHLALGELYDTFCGDVARADAEFMKALEAFPVNAPLRYSVAMHYLIAGRQGDALEQARLLARIDGSYIIPESAQKTFMVERRTDGYVSMLYNSYLFKALEIAWRVSMDPRVVRGMAPDTADAREVVQAFMEWKGIE